MTIAELREALAYHYKTEGHSLLSTDGYFPYSDKDIELVCGSLVSVRNGALQVVHLTVKEYLASPPKNTNSVLHVKSESASSALTLVCLSCIGTECRDVKHGLYDATRDPTELPSAQSQNIFLEYASFSWYIHLMDCCGTHLLKVSESCRQTFESRSTFYWIELCVSSRPNNIGDFLVGLDELRQYITGMGEDDWPSHEPSCSFFERWCSVAHRIFKEYGSLLSKKPSAIHILNLKAAFTDHHLIDLYEKYGNLKIREKSTPFNHYWDPAPPRKVVPPHRQLERSDGSSIFYDAKRNIFFWNDSKADREVLFVQSASTGRRLRPVVDGERFSTRYSERHTAMSTDGKYVGLIHFDRRPDLLTIWEIDENLDFRKPMQGPPWARVIFQRRLTFEGVQWRTYRGQCLAFRDDGYCCTPIGMIHLSTGTVQPQATELWAEARQGVLPELREYGAMFSGNGRYLFILGSKIAKKFTYPRLALLAEHSDPSVKGVSHSGRYMIYRKGPLFDTVLQRFVVLTLVDFHHRHFCADDDELVAFHLPYSTPGVMEVSHYTGLLKEVQLRAKSQASFGEEEYPEYIWVDISKNTALLVTAFGEIRRISLGDSIKFLDTEVTVNAYPRQASFVSHDGTRWAVVQYGSTKAFVQVFTVDNPGAAPRRLELELPSMPGSSASADPIVNMSRDLSILIVDCHVYNLTALDDRTASRIVSTVTVSDMPQESRYCTIQSRVCNVGASSVYIAYFGLHENRLPVPLSLFQIDMHARSATRVKSPLPPDMIDVSIQFHPSLPLMIVGFMETSDTNSHGNNDDQYLTNAACSFHAVLIDLVTMSVSSLDVPEDLVVK